MPELEVLQSRLAAARDIGGIVRTMKVLAAVSARQYEKVLLPLADYEACIEDGLCMLLARGSELVSLRPSPQPPQRIAVVVLGSEQGLCGRFNHLAARQAASLLQASGVSAHQQQVIAVGHRAVAALEQCGLAVRHALDLPATAEGIGGTVGQLLLLLDSWRSGAVEQCHVIFNRSQSATRLEQVTWQLLPLDERWLATLAKRDERRRMVPLWTLPWEQLFSVLLQQILFIALCRALAFSLAAENTARLMAMQAAEKHTEEHIEALTLAFRQERQSAITRELLDIVTGYEAARAHETPQ